MRGHHHALGTHVFFMSILILKLKHSTCWMHKHFLEKDESGGDISSAHNGFKAMFYVLHQLYYSRPLTPDHNT